MEDQPKRKTLGLKGFEVRLARRIKSRAIATGQTMTEVAEPILEAGLDQLDRVEANRQAQSA